MNTLLINEVSNEIDQNDTLEAIRLVASAIGAMSMFGTMIRMIRLTHDREGSLTAANRANRDIVEELVMDLAEERLDAETFKAIDRLI